MADFGLRAGEYSTSSSGPSLSIFKMAAGGKGPGDDVDPFAKFNFFSLVTF